MGYNYGTFTSEQCAYYATKEKGCKNFGGNCQKSCGLCGLYNQGVVDSTGKDGEARLSAYPKGRIEIYRAGKWGTLCGHFWWDNDHGASMICKQVGYPAGGKQMRKGTGLPGPSDMVITTGNRLCSGSEKNIFECELKRGEFHDCDHEKDVGVECSGERTTGALGI